MCETKNKYKRYMRKNNSVFRINDNFSRCIRYSIKTGKGGKWQEYVRYTFEEFKKHMESLFKPGMNWDNFGTHWHIDHIIPKTKFPFKSKHCIIFRYCWDLSNLQPLFANENHKKGMKIK